MKKKKSKEIDEESEISEEKVDISAINENLEKAPYKITRESKILKFHDINEVEEEITYLIKFDKTKILSNSKYILETPLTYFRIPEETIEEYQKYLLFKKLIKWINEFKMISKKFKEILDEIDNLKGDGELLTEDKSYLKSVQSYDELKSQIDQIESDPKFKEDVKKYGVELRTVKDLNTILLETNTKIIFEKIIWHFIFDNIFNSTECKLKSVQKFINTEVENVNRETKLKKIKIQELIRAENKKINIREYMEKSGNFGEMINYPYSKKNKFLHHNLTLTWLVFLYLILIPVLFIVSVLLLISLPLNTFFLYLILILIGVISPLIILKLLMHFKQTNKRLMKTGKLKDKFEKKIERFLSPETDDKKILDDNHKRRLFLDSISEILFRNIYKVIFNDLDKCIQDYKSFNPISMEIFFEGDKILPIETSYEDFFHKTSIPIYTNTIKSKDEFSLKIRTNRTIRKNKKNSKMLDKRSVPIKKLKYIRIIIFLLILIYGFIAIFLDLSFFLYMIFTIIYLAIFNPLTSVNINYIHSSAYKFEKNEESTKGQLLLFNLLSGHKTIYPITIDLREDCSYYFLAYAPQFHRIKFTKEMKDILRGLYTKLPTDLSSEIISFNIPRRKKLEREFEFDIDLEIPISKRIWIWIIGIFAMLILMAFSGIVYILSILFPSIFTNSFDMSTLRFVLTFLTLLIGFFGKDILSNPTKDLNKIGLILIIFSVIVGIIFILPIFITLIS